MLEDLPCLTCLMYHGKTWQERAGGHVAELSFPRKQLWLQDCQWHKGALWPPLPHASTPVLLGKTYTALPGCRHRNPCKLAGDISIHYDTVLGDNPVQCKALQPPEIRLLF